MADESVKIWVDAFKQGGEEEADRRMREKFDEINPQDQSQAEN